MNKDTTEDNLEKPKGTLSSYKPTTAPERDAVLDFLNQFPSLSEATTITSALHSSHSNGTIETNGDDTGETAEEDIEEDLDNLEELLRQLDEADGVAGGIESRLDGILEDLETQLVRLEGREGSTVEPPPAAAIPPSNSPEAMVQRPA
ncbi:hypothetical protein FRB95_010480 [Tulasnella sp. JGI-2019a]|nr:hypothetical protein FRB95_010480 [Tulasnella sp. JGI-2019a]